MQGMKRLRRAVTLIEAVLFISIALGLIVGGIVFFQQAQTASRTTETIRLITGLVSEVRAIEQQDLNTDLRMGPILVAAGAVPAHAVLEGNAFCNLKAPWGECIQFWNRVAVAGAFHIFMYAVPEAVCTRIAQFDQSGNGPLGDEIIGFEIANDPDGPEGGPTAQLFAHYLDTQGPLTPSVAGQACATHQTGRADRRVLLVMRWR